MIFGIFPNLEKEGINLVLQRLISILDDLGTPYKFLVSMKQKIENLGLDLGESYVSIEELAHADCILSVGGDGSFLGAARTFSDYDTLIAGIHLGDLGFLNSITTDDMKERIKLILEGEYLKESRLFLHSEIEHANGEKEILPDVLNDVVIGHNKIGQLVRVQLSINGSFHSGIRIRWIDCIFADWYDRLFIVLRGTGAGTFGYQNDSSTDLCTYFAKIFHGLE